MGHYSSFILRLWVEEPEGARWGIIQHVATRDKLRFQTGGDGTVAVTDVIEFIRQHSLEGEISLPFVLDGASAPPDDEGNQALTGPQSESYLNDNEAGRPESQP